jgi:NAD(P)H-nitrite reductase large subunit
MKVSKNTIVSCINEGCKTIEEISQCTQASTACTACHSKIKKLIEELSHEKNKA